MKKSFKAGLCASLLALPLFAGVGGAFATGSSASMDVKLGEVENTNYSVDIIWGDMTFDYVYDEASGINHFKPRVTCVKKEEHTPMFGIAFEQGRLFSDAECTNPVVGYGSGDPSLEPDAYYIKEIGGEIIVRDVSGRGNIRTSATFTPAAGYQWVTGMFYTECPYIDNGYCVNPNMGVPGVDEFMYYDTVNYGVLFLHEGEQTNVMSVGDTIGTVTLNISQHSLYPGD